MAAARTEAAAAAAVVTLAETPRKVEAEVEDVHRWGEHEHEGVEVQEVQEEEEEGAHSWRDAADAPASVWAHTPQVCVRVEEHAIRTSLPDHVESPHA